jgi:uncharacterized protein
MVEATTTPREHSGRHRRRTWKQVSAVLVRWLHLYVSMISFGVVLFFSLTGLTLNHPTWFGANREVVVESQGQVDKTWVSSDLGRGVAKLEIVEHLRSVEHVRGSAKEFSVDESQCVVGFRAPGYSADVFIDRETGNYQLVQSSFGAIAVLNDLHKGRDSGIGWSWVIDLSAIFLIMVSLTGFCLLLYIRRRRLSGIAITIIGIGLVFVLYYILVPR